MATSLKFRLVVLCLQLFWTTVTLLKLLAAIICQPGKVLKKPKLRNVPPAILSDPQYGRHQFVQANGLKFHCVVMGDSKKPLMLFLHGFPEFWFSWRYQMKEFAEDYYVVAVDLRGYGDTDKPAGVKQYGLEILEQDVIQLISALDKTSCIVVGHDWGGVLAWRAVAHHPEKFDKLIVLNCPHPHIFRQSIEKNRDQLSKSWYMFMFQTPWLPEFLLSRNDFGMIKAMYRGKKAGLRNPENFSDDILECYKYTFSQPGALTNPINYIRNLFVQRNVKSKGKPKPLETPTLLLWGDDDQFLDISLPDKHTIVCSNITIRHIPNCSHWVQQDHPDLTNKYIWEFLEEQK